MATRGKASDAFTRFTSSTPHASSYKSSPSFTSFSPSSNPPSSKTSPRSNKPSNGPPGETPAEKVARLRAAHRAAQDAKNFSPIERTIAVGRVVADKLHRGAAYSLMGLTVVAGGLAVYSFFSLVAHHRRQKRAWIERELQRLSDAQSAFVRGEATAEQLHLLQQERAGEEMQLARAEEERFKKENSLWAKTKRSLYSLGGVKDEESLGEQAKRGEYTGVMDMVREKEASNRLQQQANDSNLGITAAIEQHRLTDEKPYSTKVEGGMLDQIAENTTAAVTQTSKSWFNWGWGKKQ